MFWVRLLLLEKRDRSAVCCPVSCEKSISCPFYFWHVTSSCSRRSQLILNVTQSSCACIWNWVKLDTLSYSKYCIMCGCNVFIDSASFCIHSVTENLTVMRVSTTIIVNFCFRIQILTFTFYQFFFISDPRLNFYFHFLPAVFPSTH